MTRSDTLDHNLAAPTPDRDTSLAELLGHLAAIGYQFVTPTPLTHARVIGRPDRRKAARIEDILGWSIPFAPGAIDATVEHLLACADIVRPAQDGLARATMRVSSLHGRLFLHSAYPTAEEDAVFLGPDSYRFADLIRQELLALPPKPQSVMVDIGTGAGVGAIVAGALAPGARVVMTDINAAALHLATINARHAGLKVEARHGRDLAGLAGGVDLAFANPPYIIDPAGRAYRDGGGLHGGEISLAMTRTALAALRPQGRLILYTGSAIVEGRDRLHAELKAAASAQDATIRYREIDPDVFGEELDMPGYADVDRIAAVAAVFERH